MEYWIILTAIDQDEAEDPQGEGLLIEDMILTNGDGHPRIFKSEREAEFIRDNYEPKGTCVQLPIYK